MEGVFLVSSVRQLMNKLTHYRKSVMFAQSTHLCWM